MPQDPNTDPAALAAQNTYSQAMKDRIAELLRRGGGALLNSGAPNDATAQGQKDRQAALERKALGQ